MAISAFENIRSMSAPRLRRERRSGIVYDPATGTLKVSADLRRKARKAVAAELRALKLRLYLSLADLYLRKFFLAAKSTLLNVVGYFDR